MRSAGSRLFAQHVHGSHGSKGTRDVNKVAWEHAYSAMLCLDINYVVVEGQEVASRVRVNSGVA